jgi:hypothetical protein
MSQGTAVHESKAPSQEKSAPSVPECRHHWIIDTPQGAMSKGVCKICGAEREFPNSAQDYLWDGESAPNPGSGRWSGVGSHGPLGEDRDMSATISYSTWTGARTDEDDSF